MILNAISLLEANPEPTDHEIREALEGNYCMCTGYQQIIESIQYAAQQMKVAGKQKP
jgi:carbon-monoxide dehydrogenase small subunit